MNVPTPPHADFAVLRDLAETIRSSVNAADGNEMEVIGELVNTGVVDHQSISYVTLMLAAGTMNLDVEDIEDGDMLGAFVTLATQGLIGFILGCMWSNLKHRQGET